ncbi:MAG: phosphoserine phosphatase [Nevskia sp.]|nr:phosphoserine phosphatase [Nevskia sp.]
MADSRGLLPTLPRAVGAGWLVVCDFDGTIANVDVTDGILSRFALPEWVDVEVEWKAGAIGSRECMQRQVDLLRVPRAQLDAYLDTIEIDPDFAGFVAACRKQQLPLVVISDGIDYAIRRILQRYGLDDLPLASNRLVQVSEATYRLEFPDSDPHCRAGSGTCKCAVSSTRAHGSKRLLIGDGSSDFCLAANADLVFAKTKLLQHCRDHALPYRACPDFAIARQLLKELDVPVRSPIALKRTWKSAHPPAAPAAVLEI